MTTAVETFTPGDVMTPVGPYSHIAKAGNLIMISATAGVNPQTNQLVGSDVATQTTQILNSFASMLESVGSDLNHVMHINVFLADINEFNEMNRAYAERMGDHRPARSAVAVTGLPKAGARITMNLTAITQQSE